MSDKIERIIDALRKKILEEAIRGNLVPQNPEDEPASVLLQRIEAERERLIAEKKIKRPKSVSKIFRRDGHFYESINGGEATCIDDDIPFEIPDSWEWVRLSSISYSIGTKNNQIKSKEIKAKGKYAVVSQGANFIDGYTDYDEKVLNDPPVILFGDHSRNVKLVTFPFVIGADGSKILKSIIINIKYCYYLLYYVAGEIRDRGYARHFALLLREYLPLPPLEEQQRIVGAIETHIERIEEIKKRHALYKQILTETPTSLRQQLIQAAIQGKLVPQDPSDEPASELLKRIADERVAKLGKKAAKSATTIVRRGSKTHTTYHEVFTDGSEKDITEDIPFEIPDSWEWCRCSTLINLQSGQDLTPDKYNDEKKGVPYITGASNIEFGRIDINRWTEHPKSLAFSNDILISCKGTVGKLAILKEHTAHIARQIMAMRLTDLSLQVYLYLFWLHQVDTLRGKQQGLIPGISRDNILDTLVPLPPLHEQNRICERLRCLLKLIEQ